MLCRLFLFSAFPFKIWLKMMSPSPLSTTFHMCWFSISLDYNNFPDAITFILSFSKAPSLKKPKIFSTNFSTSPVSNLCAWSTRSCFDVAITKAFAELPRLQTFFSLFCVPLNCEICLISDQQIPWICREPSSTNVSNPRKETVSEHFACHTGQCFFSRFSNVIVSTSEKMLNSVNVCMKTS